MKKHITISSFLIFTAVVFSSLIGSVNIAHADYIGFWPPTNCSPYNKEDPTCGSFTKTFFLDNLEVLSRDYYVIQDSVAGCHNAGCEIGDDSRTSFFVATSTTTGLADGQFVFEKNKLQSATGSVDPMSVVKISTKTAEDPNGQPFTYTSRILSSSPQVQQILMNFVISKGDDSLGLSVLSTTTPVIDGKFVGLTPVSDLYPFVETPITDPRKEVALFYSPLGIYGGNHIVLYKSKEIQTLDDGSQKTITFPPPSIAGIVPFGGVASNTQAPAPVTNTPTSTSTPVSVPQSWWANFWCFIKGFFGKSC